MGEHKNPKPNQIAERSKFNSRNCKSNKSVSEYMAKLCHLTQFCDYRTVLNMLQNRLVYGTNHNQIQQKLLSEGLSLTLERALSIAISVKSAINQLSLINQYQQQAPVCREEPTNIFRTTESKPDNHVIIVMVITNQKHTHLKTRSTSSAKLSAIQSRYVQEKLKTSKDETNQTHQMLHTTQDGNKTSNSNNDIF